MADRLFAASGGKRAIVCGLLLGTSPFTQAHAQAQTVPIEDAQSEERQVGLESEIVVTAQKRAENVQSVPLSITAFGGETIDQLGFTETSQILTQVPGVKLSEFAPSVLIVNIRGISQNDFADHLEAPIAVYSDEAYVSSMGAISGQLFDIERVEVLRGPQGTLFGRNATGGLIHYVSRKPTDQPDGYIEFTGMTFGYLRGEAAVGGPISSNVSARLSVSGTWQDSYMKNRIGRDAQGIKAIASRAQLKFDLSEDADFLLKAHYAKNDDSSGAAYSHRAARPGPDNLGVYVAPDENYWGTCSGCDLLGYRDTDGDPLAGEWDFDEGGFKRDVYGATLTANLNLGSITLTSITDYLGMEKSFLEDADGTPNGLLHYGTDQSLDQFSQEFRLSGTAGSLDYIAGVYYLTFDSDQTATARLPAISYATDTAWRVESDSWAIFAQGDYQVSPTLSISAGARYTQDKREMDNYVLTDAAGFFLEFNPQLFPNLARKKYENVSAKGSIQFEPDDRTLLYASITRGHKAGNFAAPVVPPVSIPLLPHDQEVLTSYEIGLKKTFSRAFRLNASAFFYDYKDYQAFSLQNLTQAIVNKDATVKGAEVELSGEPISGLNYILGVSFLDSKVKDVVLPSGRVVDRNLPLAPDISLNGVVRYEVPLSDGAISAQMDFTYTDDFSFTLFAAPVEQEDGYFVGNLRLAFRSDRNWEVATFVKNFTDTRYRAYALDLSSLGFAENRFAPPRWYGASAAYRW